MNIFVKMLSLSTLLTLTAFGTAHGGTCVWEGNTGGSFSVPGKYSLNEPAFDVSTTGTSRCLKKTISRSSIYREVVGTGQEPFCRPQEEMTRITGGAFTTSKAFSGNARREADSISGVYQDGYTCFDFDTLTYKGELYAVVTGGTGNYAKATGEMQISVFGHWLSEDPNTLASFMDVQAHVVGTLITP